MRKALRWVGFRKPDLRGWAAETYDAWRHLPATLRLLPKAWREIPGYFSDALDGWLCTVHHEVDTGDDDRYWRGPVCATCRGPRYSPVRWPCEPYSLAATRIRRRRMAREAIRVG